MNKQTTESIYEYIVYVYYTHTYKYNLAKMTVATHARFPPGIIDCRGDLWGTAPFGGLRAGL